jgi:hypothetical protein
MDIDLDTDYETFEDDVYAEGDYHDDDMEAEAPLLLRQLQADRTPVAAPRPAPRPAYVPPPRPAYDVRSIIRAAQQDARTELRPRVMPGRTVVADAHPGQLARRVDDQARRIDELIRIDHRRAQDSQRAALLTAAAATIPLFFL